MLTVSHRANHLLLSNYISITSSTDNAEKIQDTAGRRTTCSRDSLEKPVVTQPEKKIFAIYATRTFITMFTRAHHWFLSHMDQSTSVYPVHRLKTCGWNEEYWVTSCRGMGERKDSGKTLMLFSILEKKTYVTIVLFCRRLCQFWRVSKVGVRVFFTTVAVDWGYTALAVCSKR
jgi:hypothetical protein